MTTKKYGKGGASKGGPPGNNPTGRNAKSSQHDTSDKNASGGPFAALRALKDDMKQKELATRAADAPAAKKGSALPGQHRPSVPTPDATSERISSAEDDALLFHRLFAGVTPLDRPPGRLPKQSVDRSPEAQRALERSDETATAETDAVHAQLRSLVEGGSRFEVEDDGIRVEGRRVDLPLDALRRLRRGLLPIDARIDLHGLGVQQSRAQLETFLKMTRARGERCVLVIHGKGEHSPGGMGILRGEIAAWLSQGGSSVHVAAFATARATDGGEGAVYVLLRR